MGILGIYASSVLKVVNSYESISTVTVGSGGTGMVTFSSIPSTFKHLQIRAFNQSNRNDDNRESLKLRFNSDTGSNYSFHVLSGNGSTTTAYGDSNQTFIEVDWTSSSLAGSNLFGAQIIDILDYADTNKYKTSRTLGGNDTNGSGNMSLNSGSWRNTAAISSVTLIPYVGSLFNQYSSFALYGIKG